MKKINKYLLTTIAFLLFPKIIFAAEKVSCGNVTDIPKKIPELTSFFVTAAQVIVVVILVIMGSIDLFKGIIASKEEEIKKGQQTFIKKLIVAALVFFIVVIVKLFVGIVADNSSNNIVSCIDCFISNDCNEKNTIDTNTNKNTNTNNNINKNTNTNNNTNKNTNSNSNKNTNSNSNKNTNSNTDTKSGSCKAKCSAFTSEDICKTRGQNGKVCVWSNGKCVNATGKNAKSYCDDKSKAQCNAARDNSPYGCDWVE